MIEMGWIDESGEVSEAAAAFFKTPEQGCATSLWAATSPELESRGGEYCEDCDIAQLMDENSPRYFHVAPWACDDEAARKLWAATEAMVLAAEA
ncbi:MAG: oxidoreductase, partial [Pseudomonadota bacterium]